MARFIDLSHGIESGMDAYPGLPAPRIEAHVSREASRSRYSGRAEFEISQVFIIGNTGTYLDSPYHRYPGRPSIGDLPLASIAGLPAVCVDGIAAPGSRAVDVALGEGLAGAGVLVRTGWDARWNTAAYWELGPFLSSKAIDALIGAGVGLVGVDFWNVDDTTDDARPAHTRLLDAGILIVEHLTGLAALPGSGFRFSAVPPPIRGAASFPVRAFAEMPDEPGLRG